MPLGLRDLVPAPRYAFECQVPEPSRTSDCCKASGRKPNWYQEQVVRQVSGIEGIQRPQDYFDLYQCVRSVSSPSVSVKCFARSMLIQSFSAIPNGVVNSFSTVIIRDMGFSTTMTTQLKSVGDAVQIVALLIGGTIILNVPNCKLQA